MLLLAIGPAFYSVGYTIGTGSVTAMTTAGSRYGMSLQWVLALSCLFSWVRMEAYGRFAIMIVATGTLFGRGLVVERVLDMVNVLEPFAGRYAAALFLVGTLSAGLSSVFPILLVAPLLASDYQGKGFDVKSPLARTLALIGCLFGLIVPILGAKGETLKQTNSPRQIQLGRGTSPRRPLRRRR